MRFAEMQTGGEYACGDVASALQKSIRRGLERPSAPLGLGAQAGYGAYTWRRLQVIASEDVGLADATAVLLVTQSRKQAFGAWGRAA